MMPALDSTKGIWHWSKIYSFFNAAPPRQLHCFAQK